MLMGKRDKRERKLERQDLQKFKLNSRLNHHETKEFKSNCIIVPIMQRYCIECNDMHFHAHFCQETLTKLLQSPEALVKKLLQKPLLA